MRQSLSKFIDTCFDVKTLFSVRSYVLNHYDDGAFADFNCREINDPVALARIVGDHEYRIFADEGFLRVRVFENFKE